LCIGVEGIDSGDFLKSNIKLPEAGSKLKSKSPGSAVKSEGSLSGGRVACCVCHLIVLVVLDYSF